MTKYNEITEIVLLFLIRTVLFNHEPSA